MKTLYLHIGAGKTGSSALQVWLFQNKNELLEKNIMYPHNTELNDYSITSGNGVYLIDKIKRKDAKTYLNELFKDIDNVLFSSEVFQILNNEEIQYLDSICKTLEIKIEIIFYIRDVYDVVYSLYLQTIKRHGMVLSFNEYLNTLKALEQFEVLKKYESLIENIHVLHYDSEKKIGLENSFYKTLNINKFNPMKKKKVNRSLSISESEILRISNKLYFEKININTNQYSTLISDKLIYNNPEKNTEIFYDENIKNKLEELYQEKIDYINNKYFKENKLKVFDPKDKNITTEKFPYSGEIEIVLSSIMDTILGIDHLNIQKKLNIEDTKIVDILRDEAIKREKESIEDAQILMKAARLLRPSGPFIKKKCEEYENILGNNE
jgi:hypothetical protein